MHEKGDGINGPAKAVASSVVTALTCCKSLLFPTSEITICESPNSCAFRSHSFALMKVSRLVMSYTRSAPTAPRYWLERYRGNGVEVIMAGYNESGVVEDG